MDTPVPPPSADAAPRPKRRPRYRGTHPRRFEEKYKEHNPDRYPDEIRKVLAAGKTPAGTHRSICVREILEVLAPQPGEIAVDCTLGYGGHAAELLRAVAPGGRLIGLDADPIEIVRTEARLRSALPDDVSLEVHRANFAGLPQVLSLAGLTGVDVVLADLGLSSMQIDNPERGFTWKRTGPLDLRLNPRRGEPASAWVNRVPFRDLECALRENADEPWSREIAQLLIDVRRTRPIATTTELADWVRKAVPTAGRQAQDEVEKSVRRVFQAIRVEINDEFGALDMLLRHLPGCLRPGGRVAVLTFHSGEDRRVKKAFQAGLQSGIYRQIADEVGRPSAEEVAANPRAASAKLRWAVRSEVPAFS